ncbi:MULTISPECIES: type VI secretion system-associated FHA domain protein TagH [unclassified Pseudomonas]|uniref:type VI secretion system-associated FHA domain protein TagH n=1 Tax=unclassified Pseudomonas TaxID=196821 RepID=UPI0038126ADA
MPMILRVMCYRGRPPAAELSCMIETNASLGRAPGNDLVLDDPGKYISRNHASIDRREEGYYLLDTGSNPSVINGRLLGRGCETLLQAGDVLEIGDYQIVVECSPMPAADHPPASIGDMQTLAVFMPAAVPGPHPHPPQAPVALPTCEPLFDLAPMPGGSLDQDPLAGGNLALLYAAPSAMPAHRAFEDVCNAHLPPEQEALPIPFVPTPLGEVAEQIPEGYSALANLMAPLPAREPTCSSAAVPDCSVLTALLEGLGLPQLHIVSSPEALARQVGEMLREATGGAMNLLVARALHKRENAIEMTMIGALANNPLKFFPDVSSALNHMLTTDSPAYLTGVQALHAAFDDLKAHETAVVAGMHAALAEVVQRFEPARIARGIGPPGLCERLRPCKRRARLWARFDRLYRELVGDGDENLQQLFSERFSAAYPSQASRSRGTP